MYVMCRPFPNLIVEKLVPQLLRLLITLILVFCKNCFLFHVLDGVFKPITNLDFFFVIKLFKICNVDTNHMQKDYLKVYKTQKYHLTIIWQSFYKHFNRTSEKLQIPDMDVYEGYFLWSHLSLFIKEKFLKIQMKLIKYETW